VVAVAAIAALVLSEDTSSSGYANPVVPNDAPDPSIIRADDGYFYVYTTQSNWPTLKNIPVLRSRNLVDWRFVADAMPDPPRWVTTDVWAPHVTRIGDKYAIYFAARQFGSAGFAIGVVTSDTPSGPFTGPRKPVLVGPRFVAIDPFVMTTPQGEDLIYWGSNGAPIRVQRLSEDGTEVVGKPRPVLQTSGAEYEGLIEGPWVVEHGGYYYLMYSGDACCEPDPHYAVMVARSRSPFGPFEKHGDPILEANQEFLAPGHNATIRDSAGRDWIVYHAFDRDDVTGRRGLYIDPIDWVDGWPAVNGGAGPSSSIDETPEVTS
jgi:arabinan endo-1,5-alpha-L-arabinosidase